MKTSPPILKNLFRPSAFLEVKHTILRAKDQADLHQARKMIDRYIFDICPKNMREEQQADLIYILKYQVGELLLNGEKLSSLEIAELMIKK